MKPFELLAEAAINGANPKAVIEVGAQEIRKPGAVKEAVEKMVSEAYKKGQLVKWNFEGSSPDFGKVTAVKAGGSVTVSRGPGYPPEDFRDPDEDLRPASKGNLMKNIKDLKSAAARLKKKKGGGRAYGVVRKEISTKEGWL
jgi:hypothetical protein